MRAFQLNDDEIWAAETAEDAVVAAIESTGESYHVAEARELTDAELDEPTQAFDDDENRIEGALTTLRADMAKMTEPGLLAVFHW